MDLLKQNFPKDHKQNMLWRRNLLVKAHKDRSFRDSLITLFYDDILFAFNAFFYTYDVRLAPNHNLPFCTFSFQDMVIKKLCKNIDQKNDLVIEKSRDEGLSWMVLLTFLWYWLNPEGGGDFLMGSRKEDYVDRKGDMRSLFAKLRYTLYKLPMWLRPEGFGRLNDSDRKLVNPLTFASITGESNNESFSTAGRYRAVLFDEFAKWKQTDTHAWTAAGDATPCRIAVSTAWGTNNKFFSLVKERRTEILSLYWYLDIRKNEGAHCPFPKPIKPPYATGPWREQELQRRGQREVAQEIDGNYVGSGFNAFAELTEFINSMMQIEMKPVQVLSYNYEKEILVEAEPESSLEDKLVIFEKPASAKNYIVSCDPAEGGEKADYSVIKVLCRETRSIVATYASRVTDEVVLASLLSRIWLMYTPRENAVTWWAVETVGPGLAVFDLCIEKHRMHKGAFLMPKIDTVNQKIAYRKGWWTSTASRRALIGGLKDWLHEEEGWVDGRCLGEMLTFEIGPTGKSQARAGSWDDDLMAFGIALQVDELVGGHRRVKAAKKEEAARLAATPVPEDHPMTEQFELCVKSAKKANQLNQFMKGSLYNVRTISDNN